MPLLVTDAATLAALLGRDLDAARLRRGRALRHGGGAGRRPGTRPRLLVIDDAHGGVARDAAPPRTRSSALPTLGVTVVHLLADRLHEPGEVCVPASPSTATRVTVEDLRAPTPTRVVHGTLDDAPAAAAPRAWPGGSPRCGCPPSRTTTAPAPAPADFPDLLGIDDPAGLDLARLWRAARRARLPARADRLGLARAAVLLDLKESAQLGMGPHGLCVGATGSGKSELLRTLVLALAATPPARATWRWCWSTTRAARRSPRSRTCRTWPA